MDIHGTSDPDRGRLLDCVSINIYIKIYSMTIRTSPRSFLPLRTNWFHILLSLSGREQHGYGIMQEVLERTEGKVRLWPATLYGTIRRLISEGLIEESDQRPAPEDDDERRRYYRLTNEGQEVLDGECRRLEKLVQIIHTKRAATETGTH
jgi:DNA-binding PadR family transcriptional regulator